MKISAKQSHVLDDLHRVILFQTLSGKVRQHLDGERCDRQIYSIVAKAMVAIDHRGKATEIREPSGIFARSGSRPERG